MRILVVDDNPDSVESLGTLLKMTDHEVHIAYDGKTAISMAEEFKAEIVMLDISMPGMSGYEVAKTLRQRMGQSLILIAVTGLGMDSDRSQSLEAGFDVHLLKPVDFFRMQKILRSFERLKATELPT